MVRSEQAIVVPAERSKSRDPYPGVKRSAFTSLRPAPRPGHAMASDAFVACRATRWLVRFLYFPVFLQIRNLPSLVSRSQARTPSPSRGTFCARGLHLCFAHPESRGGRSAERRSGACEAPVGPAHDAAGQALASLALSTVFARLFSQPRRKAPVSHQKVIRKFPTEIAPVCRDRGGAR